VLAGVTDRRLPLTSVNSLIRTLTVGLLFQIQSIAILLAWLVALLTVTQRAMFRRLVRCSCIRRHMK